MYFFPEVIDFGRFDLTKIRGKLRKSPQTMGFFTQTVLVKRRPGKGNNFQITPEHDLTFIKIHKLPKNFSETYRLDIFLLPDKMPKGKINTFIRVKTNDKEVPEMKIPVVGEVL